MIVFLLQRQRSTHMLWTVTPLTSPLEMSVPELRDWAWATRCTKPPQSELLTEGLSKPRAARPPLRGRTDGAGARRLRFRPKPASGQTVQGNGTRRLLEGERAGRTRTAARRRPGRTSALHGPEAHGAAERRVAVSVPFRTGRSASLSTSRRSCEV